ncbi:energy-coupling factor ABC transporter ATP-binding protein [Heliophilum fasciatum]
MLTLRDVHFAYADGTPALQGVSLDIPRGGKTAIVGANGAGKSTLFLTLNGTLRPSQGEIKLDGRLMTYGRRDLEQWRRQVGLVFQDPDVQLFSASVEQDISFGPLNMGLTEDEVRRRVEEALIATGTEPLRNRPVHALSYGQKKRVSIAGVYAMQPDVMVLDEPLAWLDPAGQQEILALLAQLHRAGTTLVMAVHQMDVVADWADMVIVLQAGQVIYQGAPQGVLAQQERLLSVGLTPPWPVQVFHDLRLAGLPLEGEPPLTRAALTEQIVRAWPKK